MGLKAVLEERGLNPKIEVMFTIDSLSASDSSGNGLPQPR
jgi:hypothetical protein